MRQRNAVGPDSEIVCDRRVDVVGGGHANHSGEESPGAENATRQGFDGHGAICVELRGVVGGTVGLQTVDGGDDGDLNEVSGELPRRETRTNIQTGATWAEGPRREEDTRGFAPFWTIQCVWLREVGL